MENIICGGCAKNCENRSDEGMKALFVRRKITDYPLIMVPLFSGGG